MPLPLLPKAKAVRRLLPNRLHRQVCRQQPLLHVPAARMTLPSSHPQEAERPSAQKALATREPQLPATDALGLLSQNAQTM